MENKNLNLEAICKHSILLGNRTRDELNALLVEMTKGMNLLNANEMEKVRTVDYLGIHGQGKGKVYSFQLAIPFHCPKG